MKVLFRLIIVLAMSVLQLLAERPTFAQSPQPPAFEVYPAPPGVTLSSQFKVKILQSDSPVYQTQNPEFAPGCQPNCPTSSSPLEKTTAWTSFSTNATVTVEVTNSVPFTGAFILPSRAEIYPKVSGHVVSFTMSTSQPQVSVEFCYTGGPCVVGNQAPTDIANPLLIFANPPFTNPLWGRPLADVLIAKPGSDVPSLSSGQTLLYFGPGLYDLGPKRYGLGSGQTAFLAGGAYVKGMFSIANGSAIDGPGILSGEDVSRSVTCPNQHDLCPMMIEESDDIGNIKIRGVTLVNAPYYNIELSGDNNHVDNIKVISWLANNDGITAASNYASSASDAKGSSIRNSFFKTGDDAIKLYSSKLTVSGCTLWQLNNAAPFEMGVNLKSNVSNVVVENSDVIRAEWTYANRSNAVFSAAFGGNAQGSGYKFSNIRVDNPVLQLFKLAVIPNGYTSEGNNTLGSISDVSFSDIMQFGGPTLPNLFQSFDAPHGVSNVTFNNVTIARFPSPSPTPSFNANRNFSLGGTVFSSILTRNEFIPTLFQIGLFSAAPASTPPTWQPPITTWQPPINNYLLPSGFTVQAFGDFDGNGFASMVVQDTVNQTLGLWDLQTGSDYAIIVNPFVPPNAVAGIGDFNGDGHSDILLWNATTQTGTILLMNGAKILGQPIAVQPTTSSPSGWSVAGIGDIDQNGYSDIVLRDSLGNVEILTFGVNGFVSGTPIPPSSFFYSSTTDYNKQYPPTSGKFDRSWTVAGVGDFWGNGYAGILWVNGAGQVGITAFEFAKLEVLSGSVFAQLNGLHIAALGDFNGDGATDMLLSNPYPNTSLTIWYSGYNDGALYKAGTPFTPSPGYVLQP